MADTLLIEELKPRAIHYPSKEGGQNTMNLSCLEGFITSHSPKEVEKRLKRCWCKTCQGVGECNVADAGDMYYNTWKCSECNGTGWNQEATQELMAAT